MGFTLKDKIFSYFGKYEKSRDTLKDVNGKGINERFQESLFEDYDEDIAPLIDDMLLNTMFPYTLKSKFLPLIEAMLGSPVIIKDTEAMRRKLIAFSDRIYQIRGTELSYEVLIRLLGVDSVDIEEIVITTGFDSEVTFDDPIRTFDSQGSGLSYYRIVMTGGISIDSEFLQALKRIITFLEPIHATLKEITYNGDTIAIDNITISIVDGFLQYDNTNDPGLILTLEDGMLVASGISAPSYTMIDGFLIKT